MGLGKVVSLVCICMVLEHQEKNEFSAPVIEEEFIFQISILGASFVALTFDSDHWHYGYLFKLPGFIFCLDIMCEIIAIIGQVLLKVCTFVNNPCSY